MTDDEIRGPDDLDEHGLDAQDRAEVNGKRVRGALLAGGFVIAGLVVREDGDRAYVIFLMVAAAFTLLLIAVDVRLGGALTLDDGLGGGTELVDVLQREHDRAAAPGEPPRDLRRDPPPLGVTAGAFGRLAVRHLTWAVPLSLLGVLAVLLLLPRVAPVGSTGHGLVALLGLLIGFALVVTSLGYWFVLFCFHGAPDGVGNRLSYRLMHLTTTWPVLGLDVALILLVPALTAFFREVPLT